MIAAVAVGVFYGLVYARAEDPRRMKHSDRFYLGRSRLNRVLMAAILAFAGACPSGARPVHETVGWRSDHDTAVEFQLGRRDWIRAAGQSL